ncbi:MAG: glycosyltransferase family 39 protein, partial [Anaerolineaceae bacterium]|nr:glycosyltransferase family 39 protein [Anaerolineaceae bacterium]
METTTLRKPYNLVLAVIYGLAAIKLLLHLFTAANYGLFVDELYFLACGQHLAWGYVDMPPLTALLAWLARLLFADSVAGIHLIPALAGAGLVLLTGLLVSELGGKVYAQLLAGVAVIIGGFYLVAHSYLSMNAVEPLIWLGCVILLVRLAKTANPRLWIWFGVVAGIGLMNKNTMLM